MLHSKHRHTCTSTYIQRISSTRAETQPQQDLQSFDTSRTAPPMTCKSSSYLCLLKSSGTIVMQQPNRLAQSFTQDGYECVFTPPDRLPLPVSRFNGRACDGPSQAQSKHNTSACALAGAAGYQRRWSALLQLAHSPPGVSHCAERMGRDCQRWEPCSHSEQTGFMCCDAKPPGVSRQGQSPHACVTVPRSASTSHLHLRVCRASVH